VGTVAEIPSDDITFFLLGLSAFDNNLHAQTSAEEYSLALLRLLQYCDTRSQGFPVVLPIIGGGASNTRKDEQSLLEYMLKLLYLHKELINCDYHIVVRETGKMSIGISDL
jgi:hypothetical protein